MALRLLKDRGVPPERQRFTWREIAPPTISKIDCDAWTRVRIILMNGIEANSNRFSHSAARLYSGLQQSLAVIRRVEQHQQTMVNWLLPADQTPLETTIAFEQVAIEVTASIALEEPDPYMAAIYRFGLLEDFDHMYRFAAVMDRVDGKDANAILQGYTDILPGRPTSVEHRHPLDDLRHPYDRASAEMLTKLHALTLVGGEQQTHDYYMTIGPMFADPTARQLYAEIASIEEQHVTQYESMSDPHETILEKWLLHEACEAYNYWSCVESETDPRVKAIWERMLDYELGHVQYVAHLLEHHERRDASEVLDSTIRQPISYEPHREFVRDVLRREAGLSAAGPEIVERDRELERTRQYRARMNAKDQPSNAVAAGWSWQPGGELAEPVLPALRPTNGNAGKAEKAANRGRATTSGKAH
jgi:rubrerythrin